MCHGWSTENILTAEIGQYLVLTEEFTSGRCSHLVSRNTVSCRVLSSAEFLNLTGAYPLSAIKLSQELKNRLWTLLRLRQQATIDKVSQRSWNFLPKFADGGKMWE